MHFAKWFADQPHGALMRLKRATGLSYNTVHAIASGKRPPTYASALAISTATIGAVSVAEVYAIHEQRATDAHRVPKPAKRKVKRVALKRRVTKLRKQRTRAARATRTAKSKKAAA